MDSAHERLSWRAGNAAQLNLSEAPSDTHTMSSSDLHIVTGAFGYSGSYIARRLLDSGVRVRTLTNRRRVDSVLADHIEAVPYDFENPKRLAKQLEGAAAVYNTYWVRFPRGGTTHDVAVENTKTLLRCAVSAGVGRFVHISISNPSEDSPLSYFRGKAELEKAIRESGLPSSILRPTVLFDGGDILINNIAWMLRRLPIFGVFGDGQYRVQPVSVEDLAELCVTSAARSENIIMDAVGPEVFTYDELVRSIRGAVSGKARIVHVPPSVGLAIGRILGWWLRDVLITHEEIQGLMSDLLVSSKPPTCSTRFSEWLTAHSDGLGRRYASELTRHFAR